MYFPLLRFKFFCSPNYLGWILNLLCILNRLLWCLSSGLNMENQGLFIFYKYIECISILYWVIEKSVEYKHSISHLLMIPHYVNDS